MNTDKPNNTELMYAVICWSTIILQFVLLMQNRLVSVTEAVVRFFTFFTILTNILVAFVFTAIWLKPNKRLAFFTKFKTQTAVAVYIFVVGFVYNALLRFLWQPQGLQRIVDEMLHLMIPLLYCFYWFFKINVQPIHWKTILSWLIYPLVYLIVIMVRGTFSDYYPYPFVDVLKLGFPTVIVNCLLMTLFFGIVSAAVIGVVRYRIAKLQVKV